MTSNANSYAFKTSPKKPWELPSFYSAIALAAKPTPHDIEFDAETGEGEIKYGNTMERAFPEYGGVKCVRAHTKQSNRQSAITGTLVFSGYSVDNGKKIGSLFSTHADGTVRRLRPEKKRSGPARHATSGYDRDHIEPESDEDATSENDHSSRRDRREDMKRGKNWTIELKKPEQPKKTQQPTGQYYGSTKGQKSGYNTRMSDEERSSPEDGSEDERAGSPVSR
jgi:hypothetical protein